MKSTENWYRLKRKEIQRKVVNQSQGKQVTDGEKKIFVKDRYPSEKKSRRQESKLRKIMKWNKLLEFKVKAHIFYTGMKEILKRNEYEK